jgi:hypothetical protein
MADQQVTFAWKRDLEEIMHGKAEVLTTVTIPDGNDPVTYIKKYMELANGNRPPGTPPVIFIRLVQNG